MKPIEFPEQTQVWAANQPPYLPLPAYTDERETISCWALSWPPPLGSPKRSKSDDRHP